MDIKLQTRALRLLRSILEGDAPDKAINSPPQKKLLPQELPMSSILPRCSPESVGISSRLLEEYLLELSADPKLDIHSVTVLRHGKVCCEASFGPYRSDLWHAAFSMSKSITGLAIGILIDEGKISPDDLVSDLCGKKRIAGQILRREIRVRHLLEMSSGVGFNEIGSVCEESWSDSFLSELPSFTPGTRFAYNSMNSYMLAWLVREITGKGLTEFLRPRLFEPLGIRRIFWECSPEGVEKGGFGLYICPEDMAKLGILILQKGEWNGRQLVSRKWIEEMTAPRQFPERSGNYNYGYHIWIGKHSNSYLMNGMFGQNVLCFPESDIVVTANAGNSEWFQNSPFYEITERRFCSGSFPKSGLAFDPIGRIRLIRTVRRLRTAGRIANWKNFISSRRLSAGLKGLRLLPNEKEGYAIDPAPLMLRLMQNLYGHTTAIRLIPESGALSVIFETSDGEIPIRAGLLRPIEQCICLRSEPYLLQAEASLRRDARDRTVVDLNLLYSETQSRRKIQILLDGDYASLSFSESPGKEYPTACLPFLFDGILGKAAQKIIGKADPDLFFRMSAQVFDPCFAQIPVEKTENERHPK